MDTPSKFETEEGVNSMAEVKLLIAACDEHPLPVNCVGKFLQSSKGVG